MLKTTSRIAQDLLQKYVSDTLTVYLLYMDRDTGSSLTIIPKALKLLDEPNWSKRPRIKQLLEPWSKSNCLRYIYE